MSATTIEISDALRALRKIQSDFGNRKKGVRYHDEAKGDNANRIRALEGLCACCQHLHIDLKKQDRKPMAKISCAARISPIELYRYTDLGKPANCPKFAQK